MFLTIGVACGIGASQPSPEATRIDGRVQGAQGDAQEAVVGLLDASTWREDEAASVAVMERWEPSSGEFSLRLPEHIEASRPWETFFVAAWRDEDGDGRRDRSTEALCDRPSEGEVVYLTYPRDVAGMGGWAVGAARTHVDEVGLFVTVTLDMSRCAMY